MNKENKECLSEALDFNTSINMQKETNIHAKLFYEAKLEDFQKMILAFPAEYWWFGGKEARTINDETNIVAPIFRNNRNPFIKTLGFFLEQASVQEKIIVRATWSDYWYQAIKRYVMVKK